MPYRIAMLADTIPASLALIGAGTVAWMRRSTWRVPYDRSITVAMTVLAIAFALTLPVQYYYLGDWLFYLTGISHIRELVGHMLIIVSMGALIQAAACRIFPDDKIDTFMRVRIDVPAGLGIVGMLIAFMTSPQVYERQGIADLMNVSSGISLRVYWVILSMTAVYLLVILINLMLILRQDPRSSTVATLFVAGAGSGLALALAWILNGWDLIPSEVPWTLETVMTVLWAVAALMSIRARTHKQ